MGSEQTAVRIDDVADVYWRVLPLRAAYAPPPIEVSPRDWRAHEPPIGPWAQHLRRHLIGSKRLLDVGAGARVWKDELARLGVTPAYESADTETRYAHEHDDFLAVEGAYDAILMFELLEHLPMELGLNFLQHAADLLEPGGVLVITTPNPAHPTSFQATDFTHVRPWPAHDLFALCTLAGLSEVDAHRILHADAKRRPFVSVQKRLAHLLGFDAADHLLLFARRPRAAR